jgi:hypothetical protein
MSLETPAPIDTRLLFRPVSRSLVILLRGFGEEQWQAPTIAKSWVVRDIVAHLVDSTLRRLSFHRDAMVPPPPPGALDSERDLVKFINELNDVLVSASPRLSPRVLTDLYERGSSLWHHQQQIRMAVGTAPLSEFRYLHAVIDLAVRGLPTRSAKCRVKARHGSCFSTR